MNIPFDNGWTVTTPCSHLPDRPNPIVFVTQIPRPQEVYILLQAGWALEQYRGKQIGGIKLDFSGGRQSDTPFILGLNIRDWSRNKPNAVNNFSSPTLRSAWQGTLSDGTIGGMDVLTIPVSGENTISTLTRIELYDISQDTTGEINPCIHLLAITVKHFIDNSNKHRTNRDVSVVVQQ